MTDNSVIWGRLRADLLELWGARPCAITFQAPSGSAAEVEPPVRIGLTAAAEALAAELHQRYGDFVKLTVGALPYPLPPDHSIRRHRIDALDTVDARVLAVALDGPLIVPTGSSTRHGVVVTNLDSDAIEVHTNGSLDAYVVDESEAVVGGSSGFQTQPLVRFPVRAGLSVRVPMLVATDSYSPALGYVVPPGDWRLVVPLELSDGRTLRSAPMPFTVTE